MKYIYGGCVHASILHSMCINVHGVDEKALLVQIVDDATRD
jgi:hypothetical protein